ncbi:fimbrial biogenesis chaperone [Exilibacterium tricleocarpae]|nr:fimbria/pilus periplasmic chaperone [Exilibacterium tricleocarpae]
MRLRSTDLRRLWIFVALLGLSPAVSHAMYLDRSIVEFLPGESPRQDVRVINDTDEQLYVQVDVLDVKNPGTDAESRDRVTDPDSIRLLVTPTKLIVPPKSSKIVRMVNLDEQLNAEKVYRVNFTPILPPLQEDAGSKVRLVVAYQVLVLAAPKNPRHNLVAQRQGKTLTLTNTGNSYVMVTEGKQCAASPTGGEQNDACHNLNARRLYPGNTYQAELPYDSPLELSLQSVAGNEKQVVP